MEKHDWSAPVGLMQIWWVLRVSRNTAPAAPVPHRPHRFHTGPEIGIFWVSKQGCFRCTFSQCAIGRFSWISWTDRWHIDSQQCSKLWPLTAQAKATGSRQDYHDFEAPLLTMLLVLASQALTDWKRQFDPFLFQIDLYLGPVRSWCGRYGVSWHHEFSSSMQVQIIQFNFWTCEAFSLF